MVSFLLTLARFFGCAHSLLLQRNFPTLLLPASTLISKTLFSSNLEGNGHAKQHYNLYSHYLENN
jgi:hypothetical protein